MKNKLRGFACLSPERRKEISSKGGANVPPKKRGFANKELASRAGKVGGASVNPANRSFSVNRDLAARAAKIRWEKHKK